MSTKKAVVRLPKLERLRVKNPVLEQGVSPCIVLMSSLLNCWSSNGETNPSCQQIEKDLKVCMETKSKKVSAKSSINYHAERLFPRINGKPHD